MGESEQHRREPAVCSHLIKKRKNQRGGDEEDTLGKIAVASLTIEQTVSQSRTHIKLKTKNSNQGGREMKSPMKENTQSRKRFSKSVGDLRETSEVPFGKREMV